MKLKNIEVECVFSGPNLTISIGYDTPKNKIDLGINCFLGGNKIYLSRSEPTNEFLKSESGKKMELLSTKGLSIELYPDTDKERKAMGGPALVRSVSYISTTIMYMPNLTLRHWNNKYKAKEYKD